VPADGIDNPDGIPAEVRLRDHQGGSGDQRLKELEVENSQLKKAVADLTLDNMILKEVSRKNF